MTKTITEDFITKLQQSSFFVRILPNFSVGREFTGVEMKYWKKRSLLTLLSIVALALPETGINSAFCQSVPAVPRPQQKGGAIESSGQLDVEEFLNSNADLLEAEMGGDFFDRVQDADSLPEPENAGNVPEPNAGTPVQEPTPIPEITLPAPPEVTADPTESEPILSESSDGKLPVTKGLPTNSSTGNYGKSGYNGLFLRNTIPVEAYGEDGYGFPFTGTGCNAFGGCARIEGMEYYGSTDKSRFYSKMVEYDPYLEREGSFFVEGSVSAGGTNNRDWGLRPAFGTTNSSARNDSPSDFGMNQLYLSFGKKVLRSGAWSVGIQADLLYGTDYIIASSLGLESETTGFNGGHATRIANAQPHWTRNSEGGYKNYGLAMPQVYAEIYAPWFSGFDVKLGHFYAPMGHESVHSAKNFFYTHSYSFSYGMPHTYTGLLGELKFFPGLALQGGFSQGGDAWADNKGSLDLIAGLVFQFNSCSSLSFFMNSGDAITDNIFDPATHKFLRYETAKQTSYSLVYQHRIACNWTWAIEHDFGSAKDAAATLDRYGNVAHDTGNWYSLVNYIYRDITPNMTLGFRFEWFKDRNYTRTIGDYAVNELLGYKWDGDNFYDFSLGLNWNVCKNITLRPEVRYDYSDAKMVSLDSATEYASGVFDQFTDSKMWTVGGDVMIEF